MKTAPIARLASLAPIVLLVSCEPEAGSLPSAPGPSITAHRSPTRWSPWSEPVNLGAPVNSAFTEQNSALSKDGLTLYIQSNRLGGLGGNDLWVSHRASLDGPWEDPVHLGTVINTAGAEGGPWLSRDEHLLFFHSDRPGGMGDRDIWVTYRRKTNDDFGWGPPVNLGPHVNTADAELSPAYARGGIGGHKLYFQRGPQQLSGVDIYEAAITRDGVPLGPAEMVVELSIPGANDASPNPSRDGREIIFASNRLGGGGGLFVSTRRSPRDAWSPPVSLGGSLSANANGPKLSSDGRTLMFFSTRPGGVGGFDIWLTTRTPLRDPEDDIDRDDEADVEQAWSEPVNLGPVVNSTVRDQGATLSPDGRSLYFQSNRPGGVGDNDLYVSQRACAHCPWEAPVSLGPVVNSSLNDGGASLSDDGHLLFFSSARVGGQGLNDIYMSRRTDPRDDFSWGPPVPLGPDINTPARETGPEYVGTRGRRLATLYFARGPAAAQDFYSVLVTRDGETRGPAVLSELSDPTANEVDLTVRKGGREVILGSDRLGTPGDIDLWVATRRSVQDPWSELEKLGPPLSTVAQEFQPSLSRDGRTLLFTSNRAGSLVRPDGVVSDDIWMATRTRQGGDDDHGDDEDDRQR